MDSGPVIPRALDLIDRSVVPCPLNVPVPWPVDERLARLVSLVNDEKLGPTTKRELVAALIQTADTSALQLWDRILRYRRATVGEAAFWVPDDVDPITFEPRKRGRPLGRVAG